MTLSAGRPLGSGGASVLPVCASQVWQVCVYVWVEPAASAAREAAEGLSCHWPPAHLSRTAAAGTMLWGPLQDQRPRPRRFPPHPHSGLIVPTSTWQDEVPDIGGWPSAHSGPPALDAAPPGTEGCLRWKMRHVKTLPCIRARAHPLDQTRRPKPWVRPPALGRDFRPEESIHHPVNRGALCPAGIAASGGRRGRRTRDCSGEDTPGAQRGRDSRSSGAATCPFLSQTVTSACVLAGSSLPST